MPKPKINLFPTEFFETKKEISDWLDWYGVQNYIINKNLSVNVEGNVLLHDKNLKFIPIKFNVVNGSFNCSKNELTSLDFCPKKVESFYCYKNKLTTLKGAMMVIAKNFDCSNNLLDTLEHAPQVVGKDFNCSFNALTSLEHSPISVGRHFFCNQNKLISLRGCPDNITGTFSCMYNQLSSLRFSPVFIGEDFLCNSNNIVSLQFCPRVVNNNFDCRDNDIESLVCFPSNILGMFVSMGNPKLADIKNIHTFKELLKIHGEHIVQKERKDLDRCVALTKKVSAHQLKI